MRKEIDNTSALLAVAVFIILILLPVLTSYIKRDNNVDTCSNKVCKTHVVTTVNKFTYVKCVEWKKD